MDLETISLRVHQALGGYGRECLLEDVVGLCPDLRWNQVFLAVDQLSRSGHVRLLLNSNRTFRVYVLWPRPKADTVIHVPMSEV